MKLKQCLIACIALCVAQSSFAVDLLTVYQDAIENDVVLRAAKNQLLANQEALPQAYALLLPNSAVTASASRIRASGTAVTGTQPQTSRDLLVTLTQPLLNISNFANVNVAKASVKQAHADYIAILQALITRTAAAYFAVLEAEDNLRFILAEKAAFERQLLQARERFKVGLDPITNVYNAKASYDTTVADEIAARNNIQNQLENLRVITGKRYDMLDALKKEVPLLTPDPYDISAWVDVAKENNLVVISARYGSLLSKSNIQVNRGQRFPVIDAFGNYTDTFLSNATLAGTRFTSRAWEGGLSVSVPITTGGFISSQIREANYNYQTSLQILEGAYRDAMNNTRQRYNDVNAGISKIKADRQAIISNESSVKSNEEAFKVGTRTIIDVLDAQQQLTEAQQTHAADQYEYINNTLALKEAAGILTIQDLVEINEWLDPMTKRKRYIEPEEVTVTADEPLDLLSTRPEAIQIPEIIVDVPETTTPETPEVDGTKSGT